MIDVVVVVRRRRSDGVLPGGQFRRLNGAAGCHRLADVGNRRRARCRRATVRDRRPVRRRARPVRHRRR